MAMPSLCHATATVKALGSWDKTQNESARQPAGSRVMQEEKLDLPRLIGAVATQAGKLGVEVADVAGAIDQVSARVPARADAFGTMRNAAATMLASNRNVASAAGQVEGVAVRAHREMTESRRILDEALRSITSLAEIVAQIRADAEGLGAALQSVGKVAA